MFIIDYTFTVGVREAGLQSSICLHSTTRLGVVMPADTRLGSLLMLFTSSAGNQRPLALKDINTCSSPVGGGNQCACVCACVRVCVAKCLRMVVDYRFRLLGLTRALCQRR